MGYRTCVLANWNKSNQEISRRSGSVISSRSNRFEADSDAESYVCALCSKVFKRIIFFMNARDKLGIKPHVRMLCSIYSHFHYSSVAKALCILKIHRCLARLLSLRASADIVATHDPASPRKYIARVCRPSIPETRLFPNCQSRTLLPALQSMLIPCFDIHPIFNYAYLAVW